VTLSGRSDDWDKLDSDTSGTVTTSPINDSWDKVFVEGVEIGMLMRWGASDRFKFNFNENATPARVQELIHAVTYQNTSPHLPYGQREITWAIEDMAWRKSTVSSFVQFTNDRPTDITLSSTQVAENAANGTVVATVSGTDPNSGDRLTFSLVDNAGGRFAINANGQLVVYDRSRLDYEQATSHTVTIRATDRGGLTVEETFTITLANVDENPTRPTTPTIPTSGNDFVLGSVGRDTIRTGPGIDILTGNRGADKLYGGSGQDFFVYLSVKDSTSGSSGRDTIYDFSRKEKDIIDLTAIDAHTRKGGNQKFLFIGKNNFHQKAGELRYEKVKGGVTVYGDVNGDGKADFGINLQGVTSLSKSDFFL
jgi:Ca2+-binding RTX toxin-like protein